MRKVIGVWMIIGFLLMVFPFSAFGYDAKSDSISNEVTPSNLEMEWEYLIPLASKRNINTISLNVLKETTGKGHFSFYSGVTFTRAWGDIIYQQKKLENSAFGIGPVYLIRDELFQGSRSSLSLDISGALIIYNEDFPADGRIYDFMWRVGPKFIYHINDNWVLNCGYKLMHVSNGHLSGDHNPAYNASGYSLSISRKL